MFKKVQIEAQCGNCQGSGVERTFTEPLGVGLVCHQCRGSGKMTMEFTPFSDRRRREDIQTVQLFSEKDKIRACLVPGGRWVPYEEFLAGATV